MPHLTEKMSLEDWLDDLSVRFIINLPQEDLSSVARICFQVEEAHWFFEDFIRPLDPSLPTMHLRAFCMAMFQHCPLLTSFSSDHHARAFDEFLQYKTRVPVRGAIMLNEAMDSTLLVRGWKSSASWGFPRGKINKDEPDLDCAIREVYEETGLDLHAAGLVPVGREVAFIEKDMKGQHVRLYVFRNIPMNTHFAPRTRKEIGKIDWYSLDQLPAYGKKKKNGAGRNDDGDGNDGAYEKGEASSNAVGGKAASLASKKFYMVAPFLPRLRSWIAQQKRLDRKTPVIENGHVPVTLPQGKAPAKEDMATDEDAVQDGPNASSVTSPDQQSLAETNNELQRLAASQPASVPANPGSVLLSLLQSGRDMSTTKGQQPSKAPVPPRTPFHDNVSQPAQGQTSAANMGTPHAALPQHYLLSPLQVYGNASWQLNNPLPPRRHEYPFLPHPHLWPGPIVDAEPQPSHVQKEVLRRNVFAVSGVPTQALLENTDPTAWGSGEQSQPQFNPNLYGCSPLSTAERQARRALQPPSAHALGLLEAFKGTTTRRDSVPQMPMKSQPNRNTAAQFDSTTSTQQENKAKLESAMSVMRNSVSRASGSHLSAPTVNHSRLAPPTDKHRADFLAKLMPSCNPHHPAGPGQPGRRPAQAESPRPLAKSSAKPISTREALLAAERENGSPSVMNPNTYLPYGALRIASRGRDTPIDLNIPMTAPQQSRPDISFGVSSKTRQLPPRVGGAEKVSQSPFAPTRRSTGVLYGGLNAGRGTPTTLTRPEPSRAQSRSESTAHKTNLLALFKPSMASQDKGKEVAIVPRPVTPSTSTALVRHTRSANGTVTDLVVAGSGITRSGKAQLTTDEKSFLMGFLQNVSKRNSVQKFGRDVRDQY